MKILAFSDWRIQPFKMIIDLVETHKPDAILYAGDDLCRLVPLDKFLLLKTPNHFLKLNYPDLEPVSSKDRPLTQKLKKFIQKMHFQNNDILQKLKIPFYYVNGNDNFILYTEGTYYARIHNGYFSINGKRFGIAETPKGKVTIKRNEYEYLIGEGFKASVPPVRGGGIYVPMSPSFGKFIIQKNSEKVTVFGCECEFGLENKIKNIPTKYTDIYLSHLPPLGKLDLSINAGKVHIGSKKLLYAIKNYNPKLVICGHLHIWRGISEKIGDTRVVNVSSQHRDCSYGNYALIDTDDWSVEMKRREEKTMRRTIRGVGTIRKNLKRKRMETKTRKSMLDIDEALRNLNLWRLCRPGTSEKFPDTLEKIKKLGVDTKRLKERTESRTWEKPKILRKITINPDKHAFVDVETGLANGFEPGKLWLIGLWYKRDLRQFLFPKEKKEFLKYLKQNQITSLVSWTQYDGRALRSILERANIVVNFIDACQRTANCVIWYTYKLHELYKDLFADKNDTVDLIPGHIAGLYADHLIISGKSCPYCPPQKTIIEQIKERNKADILQMIEICRRLWYD